MKGIARRCCTDLCMKGKSKEPTIRFDEMVSGGTIYETRPQDKMEDIMATTQNYIVLFWLIPVILQIILPLFYLAGFGIYRGIQKTLSGKKREVTTENIEISLEAA